MKSSLSSTRSGAALVSALVVALIVSLFVVAAVILAEEDYNLSFSQSRSEASLELSEAGINDELTVIAANFLGTSTSVLSSQPTVQNGETMVFPGESHGVFGRRGTISGLSGSFFWVCSSNNEWWKSGAAPVAWDGITQNFFITSTAYDNGAWRRTEVQAQAQSIFGQYAIFAQAESAHGNSGSITFTGNINVVINGLAGTNGTVQSNSGSLLATNCLNADTSVNPTGQFTSSNLQPGGVLYSQANPTIFPTTATVLKRTLVRLSDSDSQVWSYLSTHSSNSTGILTYKTTAQSSAINPTDCVDYAPIITTLTNSAWTLANYKPGTLASATVTIATTGISNTTPVKITTTSKHNLSVGQSINITGATPTATNGYWTIASIPSSTTFTLGGSIAKGSGGRGTIKVDQVQTLIFEPGDYYFTTLQLAYAATNEIVIDPQAYAISGTPGQVRFWIYDPACKPSSDNIDLPVTATVASGQTAVDPSLFRIYYGKDGSTFTFNRPSNISDYLGNSITGDFNVYGAVYAVTKTSPSDNANSGATICLFGQTGSKGGNAVLDGSLISDYMYFRGPSIINYLDPSHPNDIGIGAGVIGGTYYDGT